MILRIAIAAILLLFMIFPAMASNECMTKAEAGESYHSTFLYWHGPQRCWDDLRGSPSRREDVSAVVPTPSRRPAVAPGMWPIVPDYSFTDRWPNQTVCLPDRWLHELEQFGSKGIVK
jgi:hypothetical protein